MRPAIVQYIAKNNRKFTQGCKYEAYFLESWEGKRNSLHVRGNDGRVTDFNHIEDFKVLSDPDNLLNTNEAVVRCITHRFDNLIAGLTYGKEYKAIGRDKDGLYLVMDDSYCCYFYSPECFDIVSDEYGVLSRRSVYYSFRGSGDEIKKY